MGLSSSNDVLVSQGNIYGTYLHGVFDKDEIAKTVAEALFEKRGIKCSEIHAFDMKEFKNRQYDILADALRSSLDMEAVYQILEKGVE